MAQRDDGGNEVARMLDLHRRMLLIRAFDEAAGRAWHDGHVRGSVHQYVGQEAIAVGICANLRASDYVASTHRGHGHAIAKGADPAPMMKELFGRAGGTCGGKGGSMHIADFSVGMLGANGVVADGVTIAVGAAQAVRLRGEDRVVVAFFGDGAMNRGPLMEALNWAQVFDLPVLFACEDNLYSATTRTGAVTAGDIAERPRAFGMRVMSVDGNDLRAVDDAAAEAVEALRTGSGPIFLHLTTCRWHGHFAPDRALYRDAAEHAARMADDPVVRSEAWLGARGVEPEVLRRAREDVEAEILDMVDGAHAAPWPAPERAFADVQDIGAPA